MLLTYEVRPLRESQGVGTPQEWSRGDGLWAACGESGGDEGRVCGWGATVSGSESFDHVEVVARAADGKALAGK